MDTGLRCLSVFIVSPLLVGGLGQENYGLWVLLMAWAGWLEMLDLGMANTACRYFASAISRGKQDELASLAVFFRRHYRRTGWGVCLLALAGAAVLHFVWPAAREKNAALLFLVLGMVQGFALRSRFYPAILKGHLRYRAIVFAGSTRVVTFAAGLAALYFTGMTLERLVLLHVSLLSAEQFFLYRRGRRLVPAVAAEAMEEVREREILGFAGKNVAAMVAQLMRDKIDTQILAVFLPLSSVAQYAVGVRLPNLAVDLSNALFGGHLLAAFTAVGNRKKPEQLADDLVMVMRFSAWAGLTGCLVSFVLGPAFILRWLGPGFEPAGTVLRVLVPGISFTVVQYPAYAMLSALNKHGRLVLVSALTALVNCVASVLLVQSIGLTGVVWGTTLELVLQGVVGMPWLVQGALPLPASRYLGEALFKPYLLYACVLAPLALAAADFYRPVGYVEIGIGAVLLGAAGLLAGYFLVLRSSDRGFVCERTAAMIRRVFRFRQVPRSGS